MGGVLRDIALYGIRGLESDIDLVYEGALLDTDLSNKGIGFSRTKFGGFRTKTNHWMVDFWHAEDTWALRNNIVEYRNIESLLDTTITNWESILYDVSNDKLLYRKDYFREINAGYLDLVLEPNPNPLGMAVRLVRAYAHKGASQLSAEMASNIECALNRYSFEELSSYERAHFRQGHIDQSIYYDLKHNQLVHKRDMLPVVLTSVERQASLV